MNVRILRAQLVSEQDVVYIRQRARQLARILGFERQDQTRIGTAVSEIARNAYEYAGGGTVDFLVTAEPSRRLLVVVEDRGPGVPELQSILDGQYLSRTGLGLGILGAQKLMDEFDIVSSSGQGTKVSLAKLLPSDAPLLAPGKIQGWLDELMTPEPSAPLNELKEQNRELLRTMEALREKQQELVQLNRELEDTNRGVVALYGELDEKAEALKKANASKTRFLSNITHELRTPLGATINLTDILLEELEGPLTSDQAKTIRVIRKSNEGLLELVNDLLDMAKVEAGKIEVRPVRFDVQDLFGSLRALLRPLAEKNPSTRLEFEAFPESFLIYSDEAKISQILRNLISNALKYTESGHVRVRAVRGETRWVLSVEDSGIGIAARDRERVFEEFTQLESKLQRRHRGTGLGLAFTRQLVKLLGGSIGLESTEGVGSVFSVELPLECSKPLAIESFAQTYDLRRLTEPGSAPLLIIDDSESERGSLKRLLISSLRCDVVESQGGLDGLQTAARIQPQLIFLDLGMEDLDGFEVMRRLKADPALRSIPVIVHSGKVLDAAECEELSKACAIVSKLEDSDTVLMTKVVHAMGECGLVSRLS